MFKRLFKTLFVFGKKETERIKFARSQGKMIKGMAAAVRSKQKGCNHRKGGFISPDGTISVGSEAGQYAVIKHKFPWGDTWVRCIRCGKNWKPGDPNYEEALLFPTDNQSSGATQFRVDVKYARELTKES